MPLTQESLKYRAEVLKYTGFALISSLGSSFFLFLTDIASFLERFNPYTFLAAGFFLILGVKCIYKGLDVLEHSIQKEILC